MAEILEGTLKDWRLVPLREAPGLLETAAQWFGSKWGIPVDAYRESIGLCLKNPGAVPQWYLVLDPAGRIMAGLGLIENDFHKRRDLTPNVCAVYVEPVCRNRGIARAMLEFVRFDAGRLGHPVLYLLTDHTQFYEKCGWQFLCMVEEENGQRSRVYTIETRS